ncbi:MAG: hypothetical protein MJ198_01345 [Bacteroidales bacterium]|nr:hypothetical protein [Bacteroidales bacterium]
MKKVSLLVLSLVGAFSLQAQDYFDALRFSESFVEGNARYMAMGGALSSLGGNMGAISVNPASSASFKKSVFEFSPTYVYTKSENYYKGYDHAFKSAVKVPSFGILGYKQLKQNDVFVSGLSFSFAMNAQNRYDETIQYTTNNTNSSLTDDFLARLSAGDYNEQYSQLAWDTYLIDYDSENNVYLSDFVKNGVSNYNGLYQDIKIDRDGVKREYLFNVGVDFSEYVFFGADLTLEDIYYTENRTITEKDYGNVSSDLESFKYKSSVDMVGSGVGGKFGLIVRPIEYLRIGGAIHTPVMYNLREEYENSLDVFYEQDIDETNNLRKHASYSNNFNFKVGQPAKFVGSLGFVYKNLLNIGVDIESINYSQCQLDSDIESMSEANSQIKSELVNASNLKCGGEFRYGPFAFRAGYAMYGNPYKNVTGETFYRNDISAGVGMATNLVYCDLSWARAKSKQSNLLYSDLKGNDVDAKSTIKRDYVTFTVGFKF